MAEDYQYDIVVIGAGPGGYVSAIRASQLGLKAAVVERDKPGGVCLNWGCIPSKSLIHQAGVYSEIDALMSMGVTVNTDGFDYANVQKKSRRAAMKLSKGVQFLLKKNNVDYIEGEAKIESPHTVAVTGKTPQSLRTKNILIATGSRPKEIPIFAFDDEQVLSSTGILSLTALPKSLIILGAGAIGVEFAYVMNSFGVEVTLVEMLPRILPIEDAEVVSVLEAAFKKRSIRMLTGTKAKSLEKGKNGVTLTVETAEGEEALAAEKMLVAVGRTPNSEGLGLETLGVKTDRGFIQVGDFYRTSVPGIYAIGDVVAPPLLAHVASKEGEIAVEHIAGRNPEPRIDETLIPSAVYTEPGVASFGPTEETLKERGVAYEKATFPYQGAGKTVAVEKSNGLVKVLVHQETREILAAHIVGADATELIHELLLARKAELLPEDIADMIHAHPTISEAVMEAARSAEGWAIHV